MDVAEIEHNGLYMSNLRGKKDEVLLNLIHCKV